MKTFHFLFFTFIIVFCSSSFLQAQDIRVREEKKVIYIKKDSFIVPKVSIKYSPLSIVPMPLSSIQFAVEYRLKEQNSIQGEIGAIIPFPYYLTANNLFGPSNFRSLNGLRLRGEYRFYRKGPQRKFNLFMGPQYFNQQEYWKLYDSFSRDNGNFFERLTYKKRVISNSFLFVFGGNRVGNNASRFISEWSVGAGIRLRSIFNADIPSDVDIFSFPSPFIDAWNPIGYEQEGTYVLPSVQFALRFGGIVK